MTAADTSKDDKPKPAGGATVTPTSHLDYTPMQRAMIVVTVLSATITLGLSSTMANVAVPAVMGSFGVGLDRAQWMATGFMVANTAAMLISSWLLEVFGQKTTFLACMLAFGAGSIIAAGAPNIEMLVLGRMFQGAAFGVGQPLALFTMFSIFPPERRGTAVGMHGLCTVLAPTFGPILGGIAIDTLSWRHMFFLPLPTCAAALLLGMTFMPGKGLKEVLASRIPKFDWTGFALVSLSLYLTLVALSNGQRMGWGSDTILLQLIGGAVSIVAFVLWQLRAENPLLDLSLFQDRQYTKTMIVAFIFGAGLFASVYVIPVFVQTIQAYNATEAGLLLAPGGMLMMFMFPLAGRITDSIPAHIPIALGLFMFGLGFVFVSWVDVNTGFWLLVFYTLISRFGLSLTIPSLNVAALRAVPSDKLARGTSSSSFFRNLGGAYGVALFTAFLERRTQFHGDALTATQTAGNTTTAELLEGLRLMLSESLAPEAAKTMSAMHYLSDVIHAQALTLGFKDSFLAIAVVGLLAAIPAWMIGMNNRRKK